MYIGQIEQEILEDKSWYYYPYSLIDEVQDEHIISAVSLLSLESAPERGLLQRPRTIIQDCKDVVMRLRGC